MKLALPTGTVSIGAPSREPSRPIRCSRRGVRPFSAVWRTATSVPSSAWLGHA